jgi:hypothetical protein
MSTALLRLAHPLARYREELQHARFPGIVLPDAVSSSLRRSLRVRLRRYRWHEFDWPTLGHYAYVEAVLDTALWSELRALAEYMTGRSLRIARSRCMRLRHRDYALKRADEDDQLRRDCLVELHADISSRATGEADVIFEHGERSGAFVVPQLPGLVSVVVRDPSVRRYDRYLTHRTGRALVHRLRLTLLCDDPKGLSAKGPVRRRSGGLGDQR